MSNRFRVSVTYTVEVEAAHASLAVSSAESRIRRFRSSYDTEPEPEVVSFSAQRIEARSDETPQAVQPEGREPGPAGMRAEPIATTPETPK